MRAAAPILAALIGAAHAAGAAPQGENVQTARIAKDRFYRCAQVAVADYDDRISPANIVAKAVAAQCQTDALTWFNAVSRYAKENEAKDMDREVMAGDEGHLLAVVLRHRVQKTLPRPTGAESVDRQKAKSK